MTIRHLMIGASLSLLSMATLARANEGDGGAAAKDPAAQTASASEAAKTAAEKDAETSADDDAGEQHAAPYPSQKEADAIREGTFNPGKRREAKADRKSAEYQTR